MVGKILAPFGIFFWGLGKLLLRTLYALALLSAMFFGAYNSDFFTALGDSYIVPLLEEYNVISYEPVVFYEGSTPDTATPGVTALHF